HRCDLRLRVSKSVAQIIAPVFVEAISLIRPLGEGERAAVEVGGERPVTAGFVHHGGALEPVDLLGGFAPQAIASGEGLVEAVLVDQVQDAVRQIVDVIQKHRRGGSLWLRLGGRARLVTRETALLVLLAAAARAGVVASDLGHVLVYPRSMTA